jgi:uncharacterized protein YcbK (DUF882 family)
MTQLTKNISRHELACSCGCGFDSMDFETINVVQESCDHFTKKLGVDKVVLHINSAARCYEYNRLPVSEGGPGSNDNSMHPQAKAIDYAIDDVHPFEIQRYLQLKYPAKYGIGSYNAFTHLDTRSIKARW